MEIWEVSFELDITGESATKSFKVQIMSITDLPETVKKVISKFTGTGRKLNAMRVSVAPKEF